MDNCLTSCSYVIQSRLESLFGYIGRFVGSNPICTITFSILFSLLFSVGFLNWTTEYRINNLWIPPNSRAIHENDFIIDTFGFETRTNYILIAPNNDNINENILSPNYIQQYFISHYLLINTTSSAPSSYQNMYPYLYSFNGFNNTIPICFYRGFECQMDTILDIFGYEYNNIFNNLTEDIIFNKINNFTLLNNNLNVNISSILGGIQYNNNNEIISATVIRGIYTLDADVIDDNNEYIDPSREQWELDINNKIMNYDYNNAGLIIVYNDAAFASEFSSAINSDLSLLGIGCSLLVIYCSIALGKRNYVYSQIGMGIVSILTVGLCVLSSFGLSSAFGLMFTDFTTTLPFLILGLGVDDSFIIVGEFKQQIKENPNKCNDISFLMQNTMKNAGISILITSLTDVLAFLIGSTTVLPALNSFCLYASFSVIFVFLFNITFFSAALCIDYARIKQNRYDIICCLKSSDINGDNSKNNSYCCCLHKIPEEISQKMFKKLGEYLTNYLFIKIIVLLLFVIFCIISLYYATQLKQDFKLEWFLPDSSYLQEYYKLRDTYFTSGLSVFIYTKNINYFENKDNIFAAADLLQNAPYLTGWNIDWHSSFWNYCDNINFTVNNSNYYDVLNTYLSTEDGIQYIGFIKFDNQTNPSQINGAFMLGEFAESSVIDAENQVNSMNIIRNDVGLIMSPSSMFPFSFSMLFWEQFAVINRELYRNLGLAIGVVLIITLFLIPKLLTALLILLTVFATITDVLGVMYIWDLTIDSISVCYIIIAIGLSIDYSAHIGEAFMLSNKLNKKERVIDSLHRVGASVFNGAFSTFLAVLTMSFSDTYIFRVFFKVFFLVCLFGLIHGLIVLPVLLDLFGPNTTLKQDNINKTNEKTPLSLPLKNTNNKIDQFELVPSENSELYK